jgi:hypothetical protein
MPIRLYDFTMLPRDAMTADAIRKGPSPDV